MVANDKAEYGHASKFKYHYFYRVWNKDIVDI